MSKIANAFKGGNGKAFIPFITCGDPSLEVTEQLVYAMEEAGANLIELGIPFSDPTAEGAVIQAANIRALSGGVTTDKIFAMVEKIRKNTQIPMVFMTYANVVFSYGTERFIKKASELGMDGLILPDVPYEEKEEFDSVCKKYDMDLISLIAPTSHERISMIAKEASGFVYCVSSLGVTGTRSEITTDIGAMVKLVKKVKDLGGDFIKIMTTGILDFATKGHVTSEPLSREEVFAMTAAAHDAGLSVMAHVNGAQAVMDAAEAGVDSVEHGNFQNEESICCMAEHATIWVPTIVTVSNLLENGRYPAETLAWIFETQKKGLQLAFEKDVVLAAGSDAGAYGVLHGKGIREEESVMRKILGAENGQELEKRLAFGEKKIREKF